VLVTHQRPYTTVAFKLPYTLNFNNVKKVFFAKCHGKDNRNKNHNNKASIQRQHIYTVKPVLSGHLLDKEKVPF
jgi:hypothetical protein